MWETLFESRRGKKNSVSRPQSDLKALSQMKIADQTRLVLEFTGAIEKLCKQTGLRRTGSNLSIIFICDTAVHRLLPSVGAWWEAAGFVWVPWAEGLWGYDVPSGKVECSVGNKALLTLGLFPGQGSFRESWYRQQREGKKKKTFREENKKNLPRRRFWNEPFYLPLQEALTRKSVFETPGLGNNAAVQPV